jgi:hypothetical protein
MTIFPTEITMNTNTNLSNALESDFRALASRSRAAEMTRLWQTLWQSFARSTPTEQADTPIVAASIARQPMQTDVRDEQLQKAA